jgi:hypothetical protein
MVIMTCMKLHNVCIDRCVTLPTRRHQHDHEDGDVEVVMLNNDPVRDALLLDQARGNRRVNLTQELCDPGKGRPVHS